MWEAIKNIGYNLVANLIWVVLGAVVVLATLRFEPIRKLLRKIGFNIHFDKPALDVELIYNQKTYKTSFVVKNAGNRPAYNVYFYLFEEFLAGASYRIASLGDENIRSGVLGAGKKVTFLDKNMMFHGCNATSDQEVWIEYSDEANQHYRTVVIPSAPRGDDMKIMPPMRIKERLPMLPSMDYQEQKKVDASLRSGRKGLIAKY